MVLYSPLMTHRDPDLWPDPTAFRPDRFAGGRPAWAYVPFSAGRRTCLGAHLANYMLRVALDPFKLINRGKDAMGEVMCAVAELVVPGQFTTLGRTSRRWVGSRRQCSVSPWRRSISMMSMSPAW
jgi:hypothetical protein